MHPYSSIDTTADWKKLRFILSIRSDFHMIDSLSIAVMPSLAACQCLFRLIRHWRQVDFNCTSTDEQGPFQWISCLWHYFASDASDGEAPGLVKYLFIAIIRGQICLGLILGPNSAFIRSNHWHVCRAKNFRLQYLKLFNCVQANIQPSETILITRWTTEWQ